MAMVFSLVLATVVMVPTIALVGVSEAGTQLFGGSELYAAANTTMWSAYSAFDLAVVIPFAVIGALCVGGLLIALRKYFGPQGQGGP